MEQAVYKKMTYSVRIQGKGESKEHAIANALGKIQKKVNAELSGMIIRIEPLEVKIIEAIEEVYTERFLLLFFPRKRSVFKVELDILVQLFLLEIDNIKFEEKRK